MIISEIDRLGAIHELPPTEVDRLQNLVLDSERNIIEVDQIALRAAQGGKVHP